MDKLFDRRVAPKRITAAGTALLAGWLLARLTALPAQAGIGPAFSGMTVRASNASTVFWSPAGINRLDEQELLVGATLAVTG
jgi:long-subunit fatty acid transport protein